MKKLLGLSVMIFLFSTAADAQTKALQTLKIRTPTVQCEMCKKKIEKGELKGMLGKFSGPVMFEL